MVSIFFIQNMTTQNRQETFLQSSSVATVIEIYYSGTKNIRIKLYINEVKLRIFD